MTKCKTKCSSVTLPTSSRTRLANNCCLWRAKSQLIQTSLQTKNCLLSSTGPQSHQRPKSSPLPWMKTLSPTKNYLKAWTFSRIRTLQALHIRTNPRRETLLLQVKMIARTPVCSLPATRTCRSLGPPIGATSLNSKSRNPTESGSKSRSKRESKQFIWTSSTSTSTCWRARDTIWTTSVCCTSFARHKWRTVTSTWLCARPCRLPTTCRSLSKSSCSLLRLSSRPSALKRLKKTRNSRCRRAKTKKARA